MYKVKNHILGIIGILLIISSYCLAGEISQQKNVNLSKLTNLCAQREMGCHYQIPIYQSKCSSGVCEIFECGNCQRGTEIREGTFINVERYPGNCISLGKMNKADAARYLKNKRDKARREYEDYISMP